MNPCCPIRGHDHLVVKVKDHVQVGTGKKATTWECPLGAYRWFSIEGKPLPEAIRFDRPRWGWPKSR
jgi:hypothetical protein